MPEILQHRTKVSYPRNIPRINEPNVQNKVFFMDNDALMPTEYSYPAKRGWFSKIEMNPDLSALVNNNNNNNNKTENETEKAKVNEEVQPQQSNGKPKKNLNLTIFGGMKPEIRVERLTSEQIRKIKSQIRREGKEERKRHREKKEKRRKEEQRKKEGSSILKLEKVKFKDVVSKLSETPAKVRPKPDLINLFTPHQASDTSKKEKITIVPTKPESLNRVNFTPQASDTSKKEKITIVPKPDECLNRVKANPLFNKETVQKKTYNFTYIAPKPDVKKVETFSKVNKHEKFSSVPKPGGLKKIPHEKFSSLPKPDALKKIPKVQYSSNNNNNNNNNNKSTKNRTGFVSPSTVDLGKVKEGQIPKANKDFSNQESELKAEVVELKRNLESRSEELERTKRKREEEVNILSRKHQEKVDTLSRQHQEEVEALKRELSVAAALAEAFNSINGKKQQKLLLNPEKVSWMCPICDEFDQVPEFEYNTVMAHIVFEHAASTIDESIDENDACNCFECSRLFESPSQLFFHSAVDHEVMKKKVKARGWDPVNFMPLCLTREKTLDFKCLRCCRKFVSLERFELHLAIKHYLHFLYDPNNINNTYQDDYDNDDSEDEFGYEFINFAEDFGCKEEEEEDSEHNNEEEFEHEIVEENKPEEEEEEAVVATSAAAESSQFSSGRKLCVFEGCEVSANTLEGIVEHMVLEHDAMNEYLGQVHGNDFLQVL